jgi:hypothetical protein
MRKLLLLLLFPVALLAQGTSQSGRILVGTLATRPNCTNPMNPGDLYVAADQTPVQFFGCASGGWNQITGTSGGGLINAVLTATGANTSGFFATGIPLGNGGAPVSSCAPYIVQADTTGGSATTKDRGTVLEFNSGGACAVTLNDTGTTGMGGNFAVKFRNVGAGTVTVSRGTSSTFSVATGGPVGSGTGGTSFPLTQWQYATCYGDNVSVWRCDVNSGPGTTGLSGMTAGQVPIAANATTVTSSEALAGSGAAITTGPTSTTNFHVTEFTGTGGQIADSGVLLTDLVTNITGNASGANQILVSAAANKTAKAIDFPEVLIIPSANCNNATGGAGWSIGSGGTVTCRTGTNNLGGYISITDTSSTFATFQIVIPEDWDTATNPYIRFQLASTDATNGHTVIPEINVACYKGDGSTTDDVAPNGFHSLSTTTLNGNANRFWSASNVQMNSTDMTGCVAGALMQVTVGRATDTATNAEFYSATITIPRLIVVQAN